MQHDVLSWFQEFYIATFFLHATFYCNFYQVLRKM